MSYRRNKDVETDSEMGYRGSGKKKSNPRLLCAEFTIERPPASPPMHTVTHAQERRQDQDPYDSVTVTNLVSNDLSPPESYK